MSKQKTNSKNLYTLSQSPQKLSNIDISQSDSEQLMEDISDIDQKYYQQQQIEKLKEKNTELIQKIKELKMQNRQIIDAKDLSQTRNRKHQEKQKELIKKLSYQQVNNRQLQLELKNLKQQLAEIKENKKVSDSKVWEINQMLKKSENVKNQFILLLRKLCQLLGQVTNHQDYLDNIDRISQFVRKNIKTYENSELLEPQFDFKFQLGKLTILKEKSMNQQQVIKNLKSQLQLQKNQKKKIINGYNDKINQLKQICDNLRMRVQEKQKDSLIKIQELKDIIDEKNQTIQQLKSKIQQNYKKQVHYSKRKKSYKQSYIGDGQYSDAKLNQLENQIEQLQRKLIRELKD